MTRKVLIANAGNPNMLTEVIWALKKHKIWMPDEIHLFTTKKTHSIFMECFKTTPLEGINRLHEVCDALDVAPEARPEVFCHLACYKRDGKDFPVELLREQVETDALNRLYDKVLVPLLTDDKTEVVCLARSGFSEMQVLLSFLAVALMRPARDRWFAAFIRVRPPLGSDRFEVALQRHPDFWFPRDIMVDGQQLFRKDIDIVLKRWDYQEMKARVSERQYRNLGDISEVIVDLVEQTLEVRANAVQKVRLGSHIKTYLVLILANVFGLRRSPYTRFNTADDLYEAFFGHSEENLIRRPDGGTGALLPRDFDHFIAGLRTLTNDRLAPFVLAEQHRGMDLGGEVRLSFEDVEEAVARFFYVDAGQEGRAGNYWWRLVPAFQWKNDKRLLERKANGSVKERSAATLGLVGHATADGFLASNQKAIDDLSKYIKEHFFSLQEGGVAKNAAEDRSKAHRPLKTQFGDVAGAERLMWSPQGKIEIPADRFKFANEDQRTFILTRLIAEGGPEYDRDEIRALLEDSSILPKHRGSPERGGEPEA